MTVTSLVALAWFFCWVIVGEDGLPRENRLIGPFKNKPACEQGMKRSEAHGLWVGQCQLMWMDIYPVQPKVEKDGRM